MTELPNILLTLCILYTGAAAHSFHYPESSANGWPDSCESPTLQHQSPIDINAGIAVDDPKSNLQMKNYDQVPTSMRIEKKDTTIDVFVDGVQPIARDEAIGDWYQYAQLHFHWGLDNSQGSEHTFNSQSAPLEMHIVHTIGTQPNHNYDAFLVIATFIHVGKWNRKYAPLVKALNQLYWRKGDEREIPEPFMINDLLPEIKDEYYWYEGSLTTPPCNETVHWIIFENHVEISQGQMNKFRRLKKTGGSPETIANNHRATHPLNDRTLYHVKPKTPTGISYEAFPELLTRDEADADCQKRGGKLARPTSAEEEVRITDAITAKKGSLTPAWQQTKGSSLQRI